MSIMFFGSLRTSYALTFDEATKYNSQIILCKTKQINHWKLILIDGHVKNKYEYRIIDVYSKKLYKLEECSLYKCSPRPDRFYGCKMEGFNRNDNKR